MRHTRPKDPREVGRNTGFDRGCNKHRGKTINRDHRHAASKASGPRRTGDRDIRRREENTQKTSKGKVDRRTPSDPDRAAKRAVWTRALKASVQQGQLLAAASIRHYSAAGRMRSKFPGRPRRRGAHRDVRRLVGGAAGYRRCPELGRSGGGVRPGWRVHIGTRFDLAGRRSTVSGTRGPPTILRSWR